MGVAEMIWFADRYSKDGVKALYTFPTNKQLKTFIKTRLDPVLAKGYYSTLVNDKDNTQEQKKIRDSFVIFRSSSKAGAVEGIDIDYLSLDEYDRVPKQAEDSAMESMASSKFKYRRRWSTPKHKWAFVV